MKMESPDYCLVVFVYQHLKGLEGSNTMEQEKVTSTETEHATAYNNVMERGTFPSQLH